MRKQVEDIVSSVVGTGRARVQLSADFDYNSITQTSDKFDPEGRVLRSSQTREESSGLRRRQTARSPSTTNCPAASSNNGSRDGARPEQEDRGNRQLRDLPHHQDRGDRGRPRQPHLGRRAGRRHLRQEREGRTGLQGALARKSSTASRRWCARRSASTRSAATRSRSSTCASPKARRRLPIAEPTGFLGMLQFTKDDIMYVIELGVMVLLGLVVLFMVVRPLVQPHPGARRSWPRSPMPQPRRRTRSPAAAGAGAPGRLLPGAAPPS